MTKCNKPSNLFEKIIAIKKQYSEMAKKIGQEDPIVVVLEKVPKEYASVLTNVEREIGAILNMKHLE
eukprot:14629961-Ditylum_brightwellii.AAC.1